MVMMPKSRETHCFHQQVCLPVPPSALEHGTTPKTRPQILTLGNLNCFRSQPIAVRSQPIALDSPGCHRSRGERMLSVSLNRVFEILRSQNSAITDRRYPPIARSPIAPIADRSRSRDQQKLGSHIKTDALCSGCLFHVSKETTDFCRRLPPGAILKLL